jgi:hypothetical protein
METKQARIVGHRTDRRKVSREKGFLEFFSKILAGWSKQNCWRQKICRRMLS